MTADLLRRAAERIEKLAADNPHLPIVNGTPAWNPWTLATGPQIAGPLADLLRDSATAADAAIAAWADAGVPEERIHRLALAGWDRPTALARAILGEQS